MQKLHVLPWYFAAPTGLIFAIAYIVLLTIISKAVLPVQTSNGVVERTDQGFYFIMALFIGPILVSSISAYLVAKPQEKVRSAIYSPIMGTAILLLALIVKIGFF